MKLRQRLATDQNAQLYGHYPIRSNVVSNMAWSTCRICCGMASCLRFQSRFLLFGG